MKVKVYYTVCKETIVEVDDKYLAKIDDTFPPFNQSILFHVLDEKIRRANHEIPDEIYAVWTVDEDGEEVDPIYDF